MSWGRFSARWATALKVCCGVLSFRGEHMFVLADSRKAVGGETLAGINAGHVRKSHKGSIAKRIYINFFKRMVDLTLCALLIPALLPFMALIWVLVRRDGGPGLFVQPRVGRDGRVFRCFKFRTMVQDAERVLAEMCTSDPKIAEEWNTYQKLRNDPRISKVGKVLRATSLDELPQIFNVLLGTMSLVGPRPFLPSQKEIYDNAGGHSYYKVLPGVTGPWQVFGRSATAFEDRVQFDETYYRNVGLFADMGLILRTAKVVVCRTGK